MITDGSMVDEMPAPGTTVEKRPRVYSIQSKRVSAAIARALQLVTRAMEEPAIANAVRRRGYDEKEFALGLELQSAAQSAYDAREKVSATKAEAKELRDAAFDAAVKEFYGYRQTVQAVRAFTASDRTALGADGKVTKDLKKFVRTAKAAYQAAQKSPYAEVLSKRSYTVARLNHAIAALKTVTDYDNAYTGTKALAKSGTTARDAAVETLNSWVSEFRINAKLALKDNPVLLERLGL